MIFDYSKLRGKIREVFKTEGKFAKAINLSSNSLSSKLNNRVEFTQQEIAKATELLSIDDNEFNTYFFTKEVKEV
jgi:hypothetical protein